MNPIYKLLGLTPLEVLEIHKSRMVEELIEVHKSLQIIHDRMAFIEKELAKLSPPKVSEPPQAKDTQKIKYHIKKKQK